MTGEAADLVRILSTGEVELEGRMPWSSNGTFLVSVRSGGEQIAAIYKPGAGERPLWDFPDGLYRREVAAFELSEWLGFGFVPPTVEVTDAPLGPGSLQAFVDAEFEEHFLTLRDAGADARPFRRMAAFDVVANNADRKSGHVLLDRAGQIWGIDHGLCFHVQYKLRTVIWDYAGDPVDAEDLEAIERLVRCGIPDAVGRHLHEEEARAMLKRARRLLQERRFPYPRSDHPYPWPPV